MECAWVRANLRVSLVRLRHWSAGLNMERTYEQCGIQFLCALWFQFISHHRQTRISCISYMFWSSHLVYGTMIEISLFKQNSSSLRYGVDNYGGAGRETHTKGNDDGGKWILCSVCPINWYQHSGRLHMSCHSFTVRIDEQRTCNKTKNKKMLSRIYIWMIIAMKWDWKRKNKVSLLLVYSRLFLGKHCSRDDEDGSLSFLAECTDEHQRMFVLLSNMKFIQFNDLLDDYMY